MDPLRFDGRTAVVTGAGRGLGRAYALLLAERGARVLVNDLGGGKRGGGGDEAVAAAVVEEIAAGGGTAVADASDVSSPEGAEALVARAVDDLGGVDVLVNNAGIIRWAGFPDADADNLERHLAVHLAGSFHTARAAWPHMAAQGYGRIVMTTSTGMLGLPVNVSYASAKAGVVGLTRSLTTAGAEHGIKVNLIAPAAATRMGGGAPDPDADGPSPMAPELVAPMVAVLAHESCPVSGEMYTAGAGRFARLFLASTEGFVAPTASPTAEDVVAGWDAINDESGYFVPADLLGWSDAFLAHLAPEGTDR